jgi:DNA-binding MarR family transcriptional regulator
MSSTDPQSRADAWRRLLPRAVLYQAAIADRFGVNPTDLTCLELLAGEAAMSPTRLAELSGLTTGAVTGVLDRLERAGIVRREPDPADRRRIAVRVRPERRTELAELYGPFANAVAAVEPADAVDRAIELMEAETRRLRATVRGGLVGDTFIAPTGGATRGRLTYVSGAPRLALHKVALGQQARMVLETSASRLRLAGPTDGDELVRARFGGPIPDVRSAEGTVAIRYPRRAVDFRAREADVRLEGTLPWSIEIGGGLTDLEADLTTIHLVALDLRGGANHIRLRLPTRGHRPSTPGGASDASTGPAGSAIALRFGRRSRLASMWADGLTAHRHPPRASRRRSTDGDESPASQVTIGTCSR